MLEERIINAEIIARVTLRSHEVVGAQRHPGKSKYRPAIKFTGGPPLHADAEGRRRKVGAYRESVSQAPGGVAEWFKAPVLNTQSSPAGGSSATVADEVNQAWLPDAVPAGPDAGERFLLEDPHVPLTTVGGGQSRSAVRAIPNPRTISNSFLQARILEAELDASADSYRGCLLAKYEWIRNPGKECTGSQAALWSGLRHCR